MTAIASDEGICASSLAKAFDLLYKNNILYKSFFGVIAPWDKGAKLFINIPRL